MSAPLCSCEDAQFIDFKMSEDLYKKTFYVEFGMAQVKNYVSYGTPLICQPAELLSSEYFPAELLKTVDQ